MNQETEIYIDKNSLHQIHENMAKDLEFASTADFNKIDHNMYVTLLTLRGLHAYLKRLQVTTGFELDLSEFTRAGVGPTKAESNNRGEL